MGRLSELIKKREFDCSKEIEIKADGDILNEYLDGEYIGHHYKIPPAMFNCLMEYYKDGKINIDDVWDLLEQYFITKVK